MVGEGVDLLPGKTVTQFLAGNGKENIGHVKGR
jgi:hypothetical protein